MAKNKDKFFGNSETEEDKKVLTDAELYSEDVKGMDVVEHWIDKDIEEIINVMMDHFGPYSELETELAENLVLAARKLYALGFIGGMDYTNKMIDYRINEAKEKEERKNGKNGKEEV